MSKHHGPSQLIGDLFNVGDAMPAVPWKRSGEAEQELLGWRFGFQRWSRFIKSGMISEDFLISGYVLLKIVFRTRTLDAC